MEVWVYKRICADATTVVAADEEIVSPVYIMVINAGLWHHTFWIKPAPPFLWAYFPIPSPYTKNVYSA